MVPVTISNVAEMEAIERKVDKAKSLLILDHPFFGATVSKRPFVYVDFDHPQIQTAACSKRGMIYLNVGFLADLTVANIIFLLAHEALHYMLMHALRLGTRKHKAFNIAADKVINDTLIDAKVGEFIDGGCLRELEMLVKNHYTFVHTGIYLDRLDSETAEFMLYQMAKHHDRWPGQEYQGSSACGAVKGWFKKKD